MTWKQKSSAERRKPPEELNEAMLDNAAGGSLALSFTKITYQNQSMRDGKAGNVAYSGTVEEAEA